MKDSTKKGILKWLLIITCAVVLLSSTTTAVNNVKELFNRDETKVEQTESGGEEEAAVCDYVVG